MLHVFEGNGCSSLRAPYRCAMMSKGTQKFCVLHKHQDISRIIKLLTGRPDCGAYASSLRAGLG